uniref:Uncharacterized protein n=1 Tax=Micrurus lemniscatus lemniscatus TaxID=129467 RepID=A0A2D4IPV5_MICLE
MTPVVPSNSAILKFSSRRVSSKAVGGHKRTLCMRRKNGLLLGKDMEGSLDFLPIFLLDSVATSSFLIFFPLRQPGELSFENKTEEEMIRIQAGWRCCSLLFSAQEAGPPKTSGAVSDLSFFGVYLRK